MASNDHLDHDSPSHRADEAVLGTPQQPATRGRVGRQCNTNELESKQQPAVTPATESETVYKVRVLDPDETGWSGMAKGVREYDEEKVKFCKEDIDTLLVFAGLYSAVLSAFIIESYQFLQPNAQDTMVYLFGQMISQNYTMSNGFLNATNPYPSPPAFEAPTWAVRLNILWFSSLVVSLTAASFGMLVKQWLREYMDIEHTSPQERLRARQYRRPGLDDWRVFEIAASLPLLLEVALGLFFVGLCYFTTAIHLSISRTTVPLVAAWAFFFLVATIAPLFSPRCPFKTTLLKGTLRHGRRVVHRLAQATIFLLGTAAPAARTAYKSAHTVYGLLSSYARMVTTIIGSLLGICMHCLQTLLAGCNLLISLLLSLALSLVPRYGEHLSGEAGDLVEQMFQWIMHTSFTLIRAFLRQFELREDPWTRRQQERIKSHMYEESKALQAREDDTAILRSVEALMPGDGLLPTIITVARALKPEPPIVLAFISDIIAHRTGYTFVKTKDVLDKTTGSPDDIKAMFEALPQEVSDLRLLSSQAYDVLVPWLEEILRSSIPSPVQTQLGWIYLSLLHSVNRPPSPSAQDCIHILLSSPLTLSLPLHTWHSEGLLPLFQRIFATSSLSHTLGICHNTALAGLDALIMRSKPNFLGVDQIFQPWVIQVLNSLILRWKLTYKPSQPSAVTRAPFFLRLTDTIITLREDRAESIWPKDLDADTRLDIYHGIILAAVVSDVPESAGLASRLLDIGWHLLRDFSVDRRWPPSDDDTLRTAFLSHLGFTSFTRSAWKEKWLAWLAPDQQPPRFLEVTMPLMEAWLSAWYDEEDIVFGPFEEICDATLSGRGDHGLNPAFIIDLAVLRTVCAYLPYCESFFLDDRIKNRFHAYRVTIRILRSFESQSCQARCAELRQRMVDEQILLAYWASRAERRRDWDGDESRGWEFLRRVVMSKQKKWGYRR